MEYYELLEFCERMARRGAEVGSVGKSEWGKEIPYLHLGKKKGKQVIITGAIHARESVTALLCARLCEYWFEKTDNGLYFVPMVNPDGNLLVKGLAKKEKGYGYARFLCGSDDFSLWKANGDGVDLNVNFDARWGKGAKNADFPSGENYIGSHPFCAKETSALRDFTYAVYPSATLSYHCKGREIYWFFSQDKSDKRRDRRIAKTLNRTLDYRLINGSMRSCGGYKDWCIDKLKIPAFTVEIGRNELSHPLKRETVDEEWQRNTNIPLLLWENS